MSEANTCCVQVLYWKPKKQSRLLQKLQRQQRRPVCFSLAYPVTHSTLLLYIHYVMTGLCQVSAGWATIVRRTMIGSFCSCNNREGNSKKPPQEETWGATLSDMLLVYHFIRTLIDCICSSQGHVLLSRQQHVWVAILTTNSKRNGFTEGIIWSTTSSIKWVCASLYKSCVKEIWPV